MITFKEYGQAHLENIFSIWKDWSFMNEKILIFIIIILPLVMSIGKYRLNLTKSQIPRSNSQKMCFPIYSQDNLMTRLQGRSLLCSYRESPSPKKTNIYSYKLLLSGRKDPLGYQ